MPSEGRSVGIAPFMLPASCFARALAATIAAMRFTGSAMCVARPTSIIETWFACVVSPGARRLNGTAAIIALRERRLVLGEMAPQRAGADREHGIVQLGVVVPRDRLRLGERDLRRHEHAFGADRCVKPRARAEVLPRFFGCAAERDRTGACGGLRDAGDRFQDPAVLRDGVAQRRSQHLRRRGWHRRGILRSGAWRRARLGLRVEQRLRDRDAALAVERGVMDLGVETDLSALQAVDHRELPEGPIAIERALVQALDGVLELRLRAGCGSVTRWMW